MMNEQPPLGAVAGRRFILFILNKLVGSLPAESPVRVI
jgi:hypothetical protein